MVAAELTDHYLDAYDFALEEGHDDARAKQMALESLGNARAILMVSRDLSHTPPLSDCGGCWGWPLRFYTAWVSRLTSPSQVIWRLIWRCSCRCSISSMLGPGRQTASARLSTTMEQLIHTGIVVASVSRLFGWIIYHRPIVAEAEPQPE